MQRKDIKPRTVIAYHHCEYNAPSPVLVISTTLYRLSSVRTGGDGSVQHFYKADTATKYKAPDFMGRGETGYLVLRNQGSDKDAGQDLLDVISTLPEDPTDEALHKFIQELPEGYFVRLVNNRSLRGAYTPARLKWEKQEQEDRREQQARIEKRESHRAKIRQVQDRMESLGHGRPYIFDADKGTVSVSVDTLRALLGMDQD